MSQTDFFPAPITILRAPAWYDSAARDDHSLPLSSGDYKVTPGMSGERWTVTDLKTGKTIYNGIGPVEILREHAP